MNTLQVSELRKNLHFHQQVSRCESFVVRWQGSENARSEVRAQKAIADAAGLGRGERLYYETVVDSNIERSSLL